MSRLLGFCGGLAVVITRKEYMADSTNLHHSYYLQFATESTYALIKRFVGERDYKSIPLHQWDSLSELVRMSADKRLLSKAEGYEYPKCGWSLSTSVCIAKAVARELSLQRP